ncbi:MAG TPA: Gfo/Idh/MocA family oxidoreductase [Mycobacteriales bacterium]|nr:Gfo/Idh/MocA family oxidoreductase [Mycobacteriales bacterium]
MSQLRIGVLGAARIAPNALIKPARALPEVSVTTIAARDPERARAFAKKHGIPRTHATYEELLADPDVDAVYNPLPNALHAQWTIAALHAGKHVLCEKPFTSNEAEALDVADAANKSGLVVMEAFHWRYHPLAARMHEITHDGRLGEITEISAQLCFPLFGKDDIRWSYPLGGGAFMDAGCYALSCVRHLGEGEPVVTGAKALLHAPDVDRRMDAELRFPNGAVGRATGSMWSRQVLGITAKAVGTRGTMRVLNFVMPHAFNRLKVTVEGTTTRHRVKGEPTYTGQLRAFTAAVLRGEPFPTTVDDAVVQMRLIDAVYAAAGLRLRGL